MRWAVGKRKRLVAQGLSRAEATAKAIAEAEKLKRLTPHHLRHTAGALLWAAGASDIEVQLILGHADAETSKRLYAHLLEGSQDSAAARWSSRGKLAGPVDRVIGVTGANSVEVTQFRSWPGGHNCINPL